MRRRDLDRDRILQRLLAGDVSTELRRLAAATDLDLQPPYLVMACSIATEEAERALDRALRSRGVLIVGDQPGTWIALVPGRTGADTIIDEAERAVAAPGARPLGDRAGRRQPLEDVAEGARRAREALQVGARLDPAARAWDDAAVGIFGTLSGDPDAMRRYVEHMPRSAPRRARLAAACRCSRPSRRSSPPPASTKRPTSLGLHRHTVVYRIRRLAELGVDLDAPGASHRLWLALQCLRLLDGERAPAGHGVTLSSARPLARLGP